MMTNGSKVYLRAMGAAVALVAIAGTLRVQTTDTFALGGSKFKLAPSGLLQTVQAKAPQPSSKLVVDVSVQGKAGDKVKLPARLEPPNPDTPHFVMLHQVPAWVRVVGGEAIGNGVWLIPARALADTELQFEAAATGRQEVVVSLLSPNGTDVLSENKLIINAAAGPQGTGRTWQSLASGAAPGPATPATKAAQAPVAAKPNASNEAELVQYARHLVRECTTCHSLFGTDVGIPVMVGLSRDRFIDTMNLYRTGRRDHGPMRAVAEALDERETLALALYLGRIKPAAASPTTTIATTGANAETSGTATISLTKRTSAEMPERLARWLKRGEDFLKTGEVAQARLMFERAAEHGSAVGAYLLGTSFDPNVLPWRPGMGLEADPARARDWYLYSKTLGTAPDADRRLAELR